jgi:hypothetical protein
MGLAIGIRNRTVRSPADLAYEALSPEGWNVQFPGNSAWRTDLLDQHDGAVFVYEGSTG